MSWAASSISLTCVTALQPLPLVEFQGEWSLGYNSSDLFSPEMDYCVDAAELVPYLQRANALLAWL